MTLKTAVLSSVSFAFVVDGADEVDSGSALLGFADGLDEGESPSSDEQAGTSASAARSCVADSPQVLPRRLDSPQLSLPCEDLLAA
ncbi:hypothetical protein [Streptomyces sp. NPDC057694]|uniref:hypothetical protein n=1 Tax=Streptomyces sp. NPDC057694 TaxID=3346216 RepID=UPI0036857AC1